ncbi:hypothetical protein A2U01_0039266, partial [Trifolium medium]|nr:hypothetical protein [Trifolium medium]
MDTVLWNFFISNYEEGGNAYKVLEQISAQNAFELSSYIDSRLSFNCCGVLDKVYASFSNLGIDLEVSSYSCDFTNEVIINSIKNIVIFASLDLEKVTSLLPTLFIEIFAADDSVKGTVMLLEIVDNAAIKIMDVSSELVSFLSLAISDKFSNSLTLEETTSMLPFEFKGSEVLMTVQSLVA